MPSPEALAEIARRHRIDPAAVRAGVRTPELVAYDEELLDTPYMIVKRAGGITPGLPAGPTSAEQQSSPLRSAHGAGWTTIPPNRASPAM